MADYPDDESDIPEEDRLARPAPTGALDAMLRRDVAGGIEGSETTMTVLQEQAQWELALDGIEHEPTEGENQGQDRTAPTAIRTYEKRKRFLAALRQSANIRLACRAAGVTRSNAYQWKDKDPLFAQDWQEALEEFYDLADARAKQLAVEGVDVAVYQGGAIVGFKREHSERLLLRLLEKGRPETWAARSEQNVRISGSIGSNAEPSMNEEQRKALQARVLRLSPILAARHGAILNGRPPEQFPAGDNTQKPA